MHQSMQPEGCPCSSSSHNNSTIEDKDRLNSSLCDGDGRKCGVPESVSRGYYSRALSNKEIARYSRQLILPELGVKGQQRLRQSSVLLVGAGGLGCPAAIYLAAAGIGCIGIVDYDEVELSNLHRQILHTEARIGWVKSTSIAEAIHSLNSTTVCNAYHLALNSDNARQLVEKYDIILDCSDNVATRYLLNDCCVLCSKPLVSGSALRWEGQLTVYGWKGGPCYRCLYPIPPPPETVTNCSDGGVLGVVPGIIGSFQALEAIKMAAGINTSFSQRLMLFDGLDGSMRFIKLRGRQDSCNVCGRNPAIMQLLDYEQFCGTSATDKERCLHLLNKDERISAKEYKAMLERKEDHMLLDVRLQVEMDICQLPNSYNIPIGDLKKESRMKELQKVLLDGNSNALFVVCHRGNDSQKAVRHLQQQFKNDDIEIKDIIGGLHAWSKHVDPSFPIY
ncbi:PREDICTED: adenylyltransferase and sulfurtransferase MOCS3-like isoform X2 [Priapulus caudatus]|uniref:Adenylyltransferase and sulfurtransferase MOCS3 homolog n=1 Tax=Priapulus caudatus TaxID=37621 RepID=A0ABM1EL28_PRICU|nr:PREDICTED: adenylyltransferase and sulfurtransferase MOCS3-like isoform X2 [Priapulus caudatus]